MVKERKIRFTAVILTVVMLLGMISAVAFAKTGVIAKAANAPVFFVERCQRNKQRG